MLSVDKEIKVHDKPSILAWHPASLDHTRHLWLDVAPMQHWRISYGFFRIPTALHAPTRVLQHDQRRHFRMEGVVMTQMTMNDIEALQVMVEVFGTQQLLDVLEAIAISKVLYSGGAPLNSVQAHINRDAKP